MPDKTLVKNCTGLSYEILDQTESGALSSHPSRRQELEDWEVYEKITNCTKQKALICSFTGSYAYIEASSPRRPGDKAKLEIRPPLGNGPTCISFYYHMNGNDIGELIVYVNGQERFRKTGRQGDTWRKADLKVQERANVVSKRVVL